MEDLGKMAATLPDIEDDVPMSDEERELDASAVPITDSELPKDAPPSEENNISKNPSTTVPEAPSGEPVATPPLSAPVRKNQVSKKACVVCEGNHQLRDCKEFKAMRVERRLRAVALHKCCGNCLATTHHMSQCTSRYHCKICNKEHHTLLHQPSPNDPAPTKQISITRKLRKGRSSKGPSAKTNQPPLPGPSIAPRHPTPPSATYRPISAIQPVATLGPTLVAQVVLSDRRIPVRALLDPCAGHSLICRSLANSLNLCPVMVGPERFCQVLVASCYDNIQIKVSARVIDLGHLIAPSESVSEDYREHFAGLQLADPRFYKSAAVSLVLGPEVYHKVMKPQSYSRPGFPWAQLTIFGWVISGPCSL
ncbi:uncharacterized protein [Musca autumnalis]|uniref:uncharacterized protein n=1 Tax=Musca autumnalis TaxID=221902 RepID=UPI003CF4638E